MSRWCPHRDAFRAWIGSEVDARGACARTEEGRYGRKDDQREDLSLSPEGQHLALVSGWEL